MDLVAGLVSTHTHKIQAAALRISRFAMRQQWFIVLQLESSRMPELGTPNTLQRCANHCENNNTLLRVGRGWDKERWSRRTDRQHRELIAHRHAPRCESIVLYDGIFCQLSLRPSTYVVAVWSARTARPSGYSRGTNATAKSFVKAISRIRHTSSTDAFVSNGASSARTAS